MCIPFDVMRDRVSVHQPLWRLMAGLFTAPTEFIENAISHCAESAGGNLQGKRALLYEMPMRLVLLTTVANHFSFYLIFTIDSYVGLQIAEFFVNKKICLLSWL